MALLSFLFGNAWYNFSCYAKTFLWRNELEMSGFRAKIETEKDWIFIQFFSKRGQGRPISTFRPPASAHLRKSWNSTHLIIQYILYFNTPKVAMSLQIMLVFCDSQNFKESDKDKISLFYDRIILSNQVLFFSEGSFCLIYDSNTTDSLYPIY
jgi:hypothetical protein